MLKPHSLKEHEQNFAIRLAVLKVSVREDDENLALLTVRLFGPNTEFVIDRERELMVSPLIW